MRDGMREREMKLRGKDVREPKEEVEGEETGMMREEERNER